MSTNEGYQPDNTYSALLRLSSVLREIAENQNGQDQGDDDEEKDDANES